MGMWNDAVSTAHKARKNKYCTRIGCEARRFEGLSVVGAKSAMVVLVRLLALEGKGGGGAKGRAGDEGVAFSMRAHVR